MKGLRDELEEKKQQVRSKAAVPGAVTGVLCGAGNFTTALQSATKRTQRFSH